MVSFVLSFFPRDVLDEIFDLIELISEGFPTYSCTITVLHINRLSKTESAIFVSLLCSLPPMVLHSKLI